MSKEPLRLGLIRADRAAQLQFLASAINALTVLGRFYYDQPDGFTRLREINEATHRISGHLRDLADAQKVLTESRADSVIADLNILPNAEISRISAQLFCTTSRGGIFDYDRWVTWLQRKANDLEEIGADFTLGKPSPKPGCAFSIRTNATLSQMRIWATGEADYEVMNLSSREFAFHKSGLALDDESFRATFEEFLRHATEL